MHKINDSRCFADHFVQKFSVMRGGGVCYVYASHSLNKAAALENIQFHFQVLLRNYVNEN